MQSKSMFFQVSIYLLIIILHSSYIFKKWKYNDATHQLFSAFKKLMIQLRERYLHNSVNECVINMKLVILTKM